MSSPEPLDAAMVKQFVGDSHGNFDAVKAGVEKHPELVNACTDWGGGDFETALGAAAHMGRRDIAEYLLERGARMDLFAAAMLGHLSLVKGIVEAQPSAAKSLGPHGIPLIAHAKAGGEASVAVLEYLSAL